MDYTVVIETHTTRPPQPMSATLPRAASLDSPRRELSNAILTCALRRVLVEILTLAT